MARRDVPSFDEMVDEVMVALMTRRAPAPRAEAEIPAPVVRMLDDAA